MVEKNNDLIKRAKKYSRGAGRIQLGQYRAATVNERLHLGLTVLSVTLSAVVGTSIFANWSQKDPVWFGVAAMSAAASSALQGSLKLVEQAKNHRDAGADYGRLRRKVDMLRLRLESGDITREKGLTELDGVGDTLSDLAKQSPVLSDRQHYAASKTFDRDHPDHSTPSHAGGVVIRREHGNIQYLIVNAKNKPDIWVLPKGHIETGESAEQAARREVQEETGISASVRETLEVVEFLSLEEHVKAQFFLMEAVSEEQAHENRQHRWCSYNDAMRLLSFKESKYLVCQAQMLLQKSESL